MFTPVLPDAPDAVHYREQLKAAAEYAHGLQRVDVDKRDAQWKADMRSATDFIVTADPILSVMERQAPAPAPDGPTGHLHPQNADYRTLGSHFVDRAEYREAGQAGWSSSGALELEMRGSMFASNQQFRISSSTSNNDAGVFLPQSNPLTPRPRQMRMFLRDIIDVVETTLPSVPYIREVDAAALEYGASAVAEGSAKPEVQMRWELDEAFMRKIAAWVTVTSEVIEDAPTLRGYIDGRLSYLLAVREEYEILNGSGSAPHLKGILQYSGLQTRTAAANEWPTGIGLAIGDIENVDGDADGIAMHPLDFWTMITTRHSTFFDGDGTSTGNQGGFPFTGLPGGVWGLPVVRSRAITRGQALVGSWGMGATLFDRLATRIVVGNQHSDYFVNNKIAVLAEERVGLAVHRPDFFNKVTLS